MRIHSILTALGLGVSLLLSACGSPTPSPDPATAASEQAVMSDHPPYRVVLLDSCEYIRLDVAHGYATLTHKGNCRNPIHCRQSGLRSAPSAGRAAAGASVRE